MTTQPVILYGFQFSVYAWIARFALHEKGIPHDWIEVDPFADDVAPDYLALNPFQRVPTLRHGDFALYETRAITQFVDEVFDGSTLQPQTPGERARMAQIISVVDLDGYWPMVRQVCSHGFFHPRMGEAVDPDEVRRGLELSERVLQVIESLADGVCGLVGDRLTLADIHLAPMISYFIEVPEGAEMLEQFGRLSDWWAVVQERSAFVATRPDLSLVSEA